MVHFLQLRVVETAELRHVFRVYIMSLAALLALRQESPASLTLCRHDETSGSLKFLGTRLRGVSELPALRIRMGCKWPSGRRFHRHGRAY